MRVIPLHLDDPSDYSCVCYWVLGENNTATDRNTLIDTGSSHPDNLAYFLREMARLPKGIGKRSVEQVVLTHGHFDPLLSFAEAKNQAQRLKAAGLNVTWCEYPKEHTIHGTEEIGAIREFVRAGYAGKLEV